MLKGADMKAKTTALGIPCLLACLCLLLQACDICGPAYPERDGRAYMERKGFPKELVEDVLGRKSLSHAHVVELSKCSDINVRFLVGSNPNLKAEEIDLFIYASNDFVRSGAARNTSLAKEQMEKLFKDSSHTVYASLAGNPSVPEEMLLRLHKERKPGLLWFAMNPKCPEGIKAQIRASDDTLAQQWLSITEGRAKGENR